MSIDPVTDEIRRNSDNGFASRPFGSLDEGFEPVKEQMELIDTIRLAVEENGRRARKAKSPRIREANVACLEFWRDAAQSGMSFGYPPRSNIVLSRMYEWQMERIYAGQQREFFGDAQGEMREVLEKCWCSMMFVGESISKPQIGVYS